MPYPDLKFGAYLAPLAAPERDPEAALQRDLKIIESLDQLGYDCAWIGAHPSAKIGAISSRELFIAAAAKRTRRIRLGMGLSRPPRHPPLTPAKDVIPISIASQVSPAGASIAGAHGLGLISLSATSPGGFNALKATWEIYERKAMQNQQPIDRSQWSLAGPVHIADSRDQAFDDVRHGIDVWFNAFREEVSSGIVTNDWHTDPGQALVEMGMAVIGTVQDATEQLHRLQHQTGGFGTFLQVAHNWADWDQTRNSYELFARRVAPEFQRGNK